MGMVRGCGHHGAVKFLVRLLFIQMDIVLACLMYTARVLVAWWIIRGIKSGLERRYPECPKWIIFYFSVFIGAELTFVAYYFIFDSMVFNR